RRCGIDTDVLERTVARFNPMAAAGRDDDFHRGDTFWDRYFADPANRPNPSLGPVIRPPFYAVPVYPGDVGTSGGLVADADARVLTAGGAPIDGLYAAGNTAASVHGRAYPGPGASIAGSAVFAYRAAEHIAATLVSGGQER
ncbi:MAG TPA: FAD-binding protein, partial [Acidimicrobiia bacterium]|nr:FAD-binding protein [Acidimicrobiia bacterium]